MSQGRKKIPDSVKKLRGTDQPVRMSGKTNVNPVTRIDAKKLSILGSKRAKDIFTEKANQLIQLKVLTEMDFEQLAVYAHAVDFLFKCMREMKKGLFLEIHDESGELLRYVENPYVKQYHKLIPQINKLGSEFGFSPVARMKFSTPTEDKDDLQKMLEQFK